MTKHPDLPLTNKEMGRLARLAIQLTNTLKEILDDDGNVTNRKVFCTTHNFLSQLFNKGDD